MMRRYDKCFAPNVSLSVEPFQELLKSREADVVNDIASVANDDGPVSSPWQRGSTLDTQFRDKCNDSDDDEDAESVSSDKRW
jgi:hypothetical protein